MSVQDNRHFFFVFEYLGGGDLYSHAKRQGRFPHEACVFYSAEIALALDHVHEQGFMCAAPRRHLDRTETRFVLRHPCTIPSS